MMDQQHWWKLLVSDKSELMNTGDKASVLIQTVAIIAVTGVATLSWTDLISVLLNAVTERAFFRVYMMVTVCISTDALQTATVCSQHTCIILLHQTDTALTTQQTVPVWYRQFWTVCRRQQPDTAMISYLCIRSEGATGCNRSVAFLRV